MPTIEKTDAGYRIIAHENHRIVRDFVDVETGYRVLEEYLEGFGLKTITIDAESGDIVDPNDRVSVIGENILQIENYNVVTVRTRDSETGHELVDETLVDRKSGSVLHTRGYVAFMPKAQMPIIETHKKKLELKAERAAEKANFRNLPREEQILRLTREFRQARRARAELGDDENVIFDADEFASFREMAPEIDTMLEEILRRVFIGCRLRDETDARRRLGLEGK